MSVVVDLVKQTKESCNPREGWITWLSFMSYMNCMLNDSIINVLVTCHYCGEYKLGFASVNHTYSHTNVALIFNIESDTPWSKLHTPTKCSIGTLFEHVIYSWAGLQSKQCSTSHVQSRWSNRHYLCISASMYITSCQI